jgi:hypothetical protein
VSYATLGALVNLSILSGHLPFAVRNPSYVVAMFALPMLALLVGLMFLRRAFPCLP